MHTVGLSIILSSSAIPRHSLFSLFFHTHTLSLSSSIRDCDELYPEEMKASVLDIHNIPCGERDDESFGSAEYYAEQTAFNEDGSFIGVYHSRGSEESAPPTYQPAIESDV